MVSAPLNLDEVLETIYRETTQVLPADAFFIALYDVQKNELDFRVRVDEGKREPPERRPLGQNLTAHVIEKKQPLLIRDWEMEKEHLPQPRVWGTMKMPASWLGVPISIGERAVGVISVKAYHPHAYDTEELLLLSTIADQAAVAIENARLFEEARRRALEQSTISGIARALNATLDVRQAFPTIVQGLRTLTDCERVSLALVDEDREHFTMFMLDEPRPELDEGVRMPIAATSAVADVRAGRVHLTDDLSTESDYPAEQALYQAGYRSRVNLPLMVGKEVIGTLNIASRQLGSFTTAQLPVLQQIADALAIAIENSRLFEAEKTRRMELDTLYDLSRTLADVNDFGATLNLITRHAVERIHVTFAQVVLLENDYFVQRAVYPLNVHDCNLERYEPVATHPFCRRVLEQNVPTVVRTDSPELAPGECAALFLGIAQTLCLVPLRIGERALGLLLLGEARRAEREPFTQEKIRLARSIGDQAASALHRTELFSQIERAYLQTVLALANAVEAKDTYTADHAERLAEMAIKIGRALGMTAHELEDLRYGAILHDIGKIGIRDAVLQKPGKLDLTEWSEMQHHPEMGERILSPVPRLAGAACIVRHHHERFDGGGYPDMLAGEAIPLGARILTVVDAYSAIVDQRVYKPPRPHTEAITELKRCAGTQFDPQVVLVFLGIWDYGIEKQEHGV